MGKCAELTPYVTEEVAKVQARLFSECYVGRPKMEAFKCAEADHWHVERAEILRRRESEA